jgi:hypothetical protein
MLVFWVVTLCASFFRAEDGGSIFLQNIGIYLQVNMALQRRRPTSTSSPWDPQILYIAMKVKQDMESPPHKEEERKAVCLHYIGW